MDKTLKIAVLLTAVDKMSSAVGSAVSKSQSKLKGFQKGLNSFGTFGVVAGGAVTAYFATAIKSAEEAKRAEDKLALAFRNSIKDTGAAARAMADYASEIQKKIAVEDEEIMAVETKLAGFSKVAQRADLFKQAIMSAYDFQAIGKGDAMSNIEKIGRMLSNPLTNLGAMKKAGIEFSEAEKKKITALIKTNRTAAAQDIIMKKISAKAKGQAEANADPWKKMAIAVGEVNEKVGNGLLPIVTKVANYFSGTLIPKVEAFTKAHPRLVKWVGIGSVALLGLGVAAKVIAFVMAGLVPVIKGVAFAFKFLGNVIKVVRLIVMLGGGPILLIIAAVAAGAFLIIRHWSKIKAWIANLWNKVAAIFKSAVQGIKYVFLNFTPHGLIFKHWDKISGFFTGLWNKVKGVFWGFVDWIKGLGGTFLEAGKNIVRSIWTGIKAMANKPIEAISNIVQKIRNFLPFSPAKTGALKDIHKIKLVETIAATVKHQPLTNAMRKVTTAVANQGGRTRSNYGGGGGNTFVFAPVINGGNAKDNRLMLGDLSKEMFAKFEEWNRQKSRKQY